jgi:hypothetical protein
MWRRRASRRRDYGIARALGAFVPGPCHRPRPPDIGRCGSHDSFRRRTHGWSVREAGKRKPAPIAVRRSKRVLHHTFVQAMSAASYVTLALSPVYAPTFPESASAYPNHLLTPADQGPYVPQTPPCVPRVEPQVACQHAPASQVSACVPRAELQAPRSASQLAAHRRSLQRHGYPDGPSRP